MSYGKMTKKELYDLAQKMNIAGRSTLDKDGLIKAIRKYEKTVAGKDTAHDTAVSSHSQPQHEQPAYRPSKPEYPIPDRYNIDTVVLLPVNPKKEYVYWEVSDKTVNSFCASHGAAASFILKVFAAEGDDDSRELASVKVGKYGNWYFDLYCPDAMMWSEIGMLDSMGNYFTVSSSKKIKMPTDRISDLIDQETWMTVGENIEKIYTLSGITDMQKQELLSSARMHSELFKKLHNAEGMAGSSSSMIKKDGK